MIKILFTALPVFMLSACWQNQALVNKNFIIANGQMPHLVKDKADKLHLVYGSADSIMYVYSGDEGASFASPALVAVLPKLAASHTRGPQIAVSNNVVTVLACNTLGDIFCYTKTTFGNWQQSAKVNDADTVARENFIALSAGEANTFAVWLDLRGNKKNKIFGAKSIDGGRTWNKNIMVYASPDTTVCECCKPSVVVKENQVYVMFRNWLNGNRDMYLSQSKDGGNTFDTAQKLGNGNWKLNGCPMDGGSVAINNKGVIQTVWRRESKVYAAIPGMPEIEIGEGKGSTVETVDDINVYAWTENGVVVILKPDGKKLILGKGSQPVLKALRNKQMICVWENEQQIHASVFKL